MLGIVMVIILVLSTAVVNNAYPVVTEPQRRRFRSLHDGDDSRHENLSGKKDPWELNQGLNKSFFEGDIVLDANLRKIIYGGSSTRKKRAIKKDPKSRWINGVVPFTFHRNLSSLARKEIHKAIRHWKRHTCLRFRKKRHGDKDFIQFVGEDGCWSTIGRKGGKQKIGVGKGCEYFGTIIHEIGHAMGMWHEQSRTDRDTYIKVIWANILDDYHDQFNEITPPTDADSMGYAYDYESIMHYGDRFFSKNKKRTLRIRRPGRQANLRIGQRKRLSYIDVAQIHAMYNCNKKSTGSSAKCPWKRGDKGHSYRGKLSYTEKGVTCQPWDKQWPHKHKEIKRDRRLDRHNGFMEYNKRTGSFNYHNYCRNPRGKRKRPWCYTTLKKPSWQYCGPKIC